VGPAKSQTRPKARRSPGILSSESAFQAFVPSQRPRRFPRDCGLMDLRSHSATRRRPRRTTRPTRLAVRGHQAGKRRSAQCVYQHETAEVDGEFRTRTDALDPALTCLLWQGGYWSSVLLVVGAADPIRGAPRRLHDRATLADRDLRRIQRNLADRTTSESFTLGDVTVHLPTLLDNIKFETSHDDARLQVADVLAGAAAHLYAVATGARRDEADFAKSLHRAGVAGLVKEALGPSERVPPSTTPRTAAATQGASNIAASYRRYEA
jgi:hypothetical protein